MPNTLRIASLFLFAATIVSCGDKDDGTPANLTAPVDADGDGYPEEHDCDDNDPSRNPGAIEVCDGIDQDCDDLIDENATDLQTFYADADGDGFGDALAERITCDAPVGFVMDATDCDDANSAVFPGAEEVCNQSDDDCDGLVDADDPDIDPSNLYTVWPDLDDDDHGDANAPSFLSCEDRDDVSLDNLDCDDSDPATYIGVATLDNPDACMQDIDNDGWGSDRPTSAAARPGSDCDDGRALRNPGLSEFCDDTDNDCDDIVDEDCVGDAPGG